MTEPAGPARPITLLHVFSTFAVGGPQTRFATIADRLGGKYRHLIVSMSGKTEATGLLSGNVDYQLVPIRNTPGNPLANIRRFADQLGRLKPDMLVTYNWGALEWAIGNRFGPRLPHVHIEDGFGPDEAVTRFKRRVWLRRVGLKSARAVAVPSHYLERIARDEWKLKHTRIVYLPNGVDMVRFSARIPLAERAFAKQPGEVVVGTCAALRPEKNLARLIRAFAACASANSRLVIVGDGPERPVLQTVVTESDLGNRVLFTGHLAQPERALANFDIFAMSSDTEQMPYGLLEAMAAGLPAVATDVGDTKSIVAESNSPYIVGLSDPAALTAALRTMLRDAALRTKLGADNREKAQREFSLETMVAAYDRLFGG
jgi:glycosyltransferase involved in cell wall biosynthesis